MATLLSVNVGRPRNVAWNNRTVYTAAWKHPVTGPRMVRRLNVEGDGQGDLGGHGGENRAVLVYQQASYQHWAKEFDRDDLLPGHFGENLTVDGLPDDEVCIGDRYQIGQAVLEVTQPRVTCYRVGLRLAEPRMAALLVSHRRPGFYCRVIAEGEIEAGQDIIKIVSGPEQVTVADIDALLYLPGHPRDALERAIRVPALSPGWRTSLQYLAYQASDSSSSGGNTGLTAAASGPPPAWTGFRPLVVTAVHDESRNVRSIVLADPAGVALPAWRPGQSITLRLVRDKDHGTLVRSYSLSNLTGSDCYRISVKRDDRGLASEHIHSSLKLGDSIDVAAPRGTFFLTEGDTPIILVSAGIGATPLLSMLHSLVKAGTTRQVWWLHGARNGSEHPFAAESRSLLEQLPHGQFCIFYSSPTPTDRPGIDFTEHGRLSIEAFDKLDLTRNADMYLCGPPAFMDGFTAAWAARGLDPARIHTETFGTAPALTPGVAATAIAPHQPVGQPGPGPEVQFARSGLSVSWGPPSTSLLEFAETCDVPTRWSCRTGVCHNCETALLSGSVSYDPEPLEPPAEGNVLICCSRPVRPVVLDL
jgi:ferredoxin-NADP reductase/MOSC domain-containing protein YiiM